MPLLQDVAKRTRRTCSCCCFCKPWASTPSGKNFPSGKHCKLHSKQLPSAGTSTGVKPEGRHRHKGHPGFAACQFLLCGKPKRPGDAQLRLELPRLGLHLTVLNSHNAWYPTLPSISAETAGTQWFCLPCNCLYVAARSKARRCH